MAGAMPQQGPAGGAALAAAIAARLPMHMSYAELRALALDEAPRLEELYDVGHSVGHGGFGYVFRGVRRAGGANVVVAVKYLVPKRYIDDALRRKALREPLFLRLQAGLNHPNLLRIFTAHEVLWNAQPTLAVVTDFAEGADLLTNIALWQQRNGTGAANQQVGASPFTEVTVADIVRKLADVVHALHQAGILHLDLKPDNIFLRRPTAPGAAFNVEDLILGDVGLSYLLDEVAAGYVPEPADRGTAHYNSPEKQSRGICTEAADVWALGVILYILLCGEWPFGNQPPSTPYARFEPRPDSSWWAVEAWRTMTPDAKDLIQRMLTFDPAQRITLPQVLGHPWFQAVNEGAPRPLPLAVTGITAMSKAQRFWGKLVGLMNVLGATLPLLGANLGSEMTEDVRARLTKAFQQLSLRSGRHGGALDLPGWMAVLKDAGLRYKERPGDPITPPDAMAERVFRQFDVNGDGLVDYAELQAGLQALYNSDLETLDLLFDALDIDETGSLDADGMTRMMHPVAFHRMLSRLGSGGSLPHSLVSLDSLIPSGGAGGAGAGAGAGGGAAGGGRGLHGELQQVFAALDREGMGRVTKEAFRERVASRPDLRAILLRPVRTLAHAMAPAHLQAGDVQGAGAAAAAGGGAAGGGTGGGAGASAGAGAGAGR